MRKLIFIASICIAQLADAQVQTEYYSNGKKKSEGEYLSSGTGTSVVFASDGSTRQSPVQTKKGSWNYWYDSGIKSSEESYTNGVSSGVWKTWYPDGVKSSEINYASHKATFWYKNGIKQSEGEMLENRVFNGKWTGWQENGVKSYEGNYLNGKKEGDWNWYDSAGKLASKQIFKNDELLDTQKY